MLRSNFKDPAAPPTPPPPPQAGLSVPQHLRVPVAPSLPTDLPNPRTLSICDAWFTARTVIANITEDREAEKASEILAQT